MIPFGSKLVSLEQPQLVPLGGGQAIRAFFPPERQTDLLRQHAHRFGKRQSFRLHDELDHVSALSAAEAFENLFFPGYMERRSLFGMERA